MSGLGVMSFIFYAVMEVAREGGRVMKRMI
jgi:hypothetical protein